MKRLIAVLGLVVLAGCGVDGEPIPPGSETEDSPITPRPKINGGITLGTNGSTTSVSTSVISGNVTVGVGTTF